MTILQYATFTCISKITLHCTFNIIVTTIRLLCHIDILLCNNKKSNNK